MANSDKDIRVVPNRNKSGLPNIAFTGYNNDPIVLNVLDDNTISFEGSSGQLFSVSNAVTTGTIFSVNDISGIPSFRVDADGTVGIAEFSGNVGIGLQSPQSKLSVGGDINVGAGYTFRVAGTKVLDSSSLGTGVTGSSLTSVGTISSGTWQGTAIGVNYGGTGATNASDSRSFLGAATAGTNSDLTRLLGVQHLFVTIPTAAAIGITVKAATSQSASMMEFVNSSNSVMSWITKDGTFSHGAYFTHSDGRVPGFSVQRANAAGIVARGYNSANFAAIEVQDNPGALVVGLYPSGLVYGGVLQAYSSTASTNTTTGALIVAGGAAIAGTTNFGRDVRIFSSLASSSPFTGSLVVSGGVGISNNLFVGGGVAFTSSIASTSTTTGTLVVTGGVGIGGSVFTSTSNASSISGVVLSNGSVTLTGTYTQSNSSTTAFQVRDGSNNPAFVIDTIGDIISLPVAVASTSTGTGSLVVAGGVGIGGSLFVGNTLRVASSTASTSTTTGALIVSGGVGISGSINASDVVRSGQLIAPTFTLSALGNTGALSPSTTYYYKLSSLDYFGNESLPSNEASIALNSSTYAVNIAPNIDQSIYAIKIYRTTTSNSYTNSLVDTYYPFRGASNASNIAYNYYDRGKSTSSSSPVTVSTANRAVLGSSINSTLGKLNLAGQLLIQSKNASAPSANIGIQLGNYDIAAVKDGLLAYFSSITSATGGTLTAGTTYYYIMTGVDSYGNETFPSKEFPFLADANGAAQMNIGGGDYGIIKYRFYRTTNPGNYTNCYIGELPGNIDINYPTQNVSPPTSSSANAYVLKSTPQENIPSYIDSLDVRPGLSGAVRKLADNLYNTISGIVTSGIAGTLAQNTNYYYKVASYDRYGNTSSASSPYIINTGPATSIQITPMGVDWPVGVEGFLVYRSTSKDNFTNVPTFYAYPGTAITDTGNYEFISSAPTYNNYLLGNFGGYYYGYANFYVRSLDIAAGGNQLSMNFLSGRSPLPTLSASTGGTLTPGDIYYYKVMAFGRGDDYSMASPAVRFVVGAGGAVRISVNSIGITGFRNYNIYRTANLSNWTNSQIARYVSESDFIDIGYPSTAGNPTDHAGVKRGTTATISDGAITALTARINSFTQDIAAPGGITISGTTGGILTTNSTYYYRIMAVGVGFNEFGQASKQVIYTTSATQNAISLSWGLVPNATGYRVLRSTTNNAGAGQTYTFVHGTSFVDKGYATSQHVYDPYALYYPGSYGATISANSNRYHLPFLNITNGENPALTVSMLPPTISSTSTGTGGTLANDTNYYYIVEAYDYNGGSSLPSTEVVVNTGANNSVTLTWTEKNGAFYHKIYRSSNSDFTNKQINQTVYTNTFTDINYPTVNTSPRYSSTNGSMYRIGTVNTSGVYHGLFSRSVFQTTPTPQGAYGTDYAIRVAGRPASSIYGALFELGDFLSTGYNGSNLGTYFGLSSATGFTGNFIDLQASSISRFKVDYLGNSTIGSTTGSGSTSTGALIVTGGVGIGQSLFTSPSYSSSISGAIFSNGSATLSGTFTQNNSSTTAFQVRDGSNNPAFVIDTIADIISLPVAVASTSTGTGSLVVAGGVGIGGSLFVGNNSSIGGTLNIAGNSSIGGTLSVSGNASVGGTLNISGNASIGGTLNVSGSNSYFQNNLYVGNNTQGRLYFSQATLGSAGTTVIPTMAFIGATNSPITLSVLPDNSLSFDGSSGQLFSINNNLSTGWIFSINDISGLPIFRTNADLTVAMGEYGGNVGIGLSNPTFKLQVSGNAGISGTTLISNTTTSTNTTSGALVVSGGVGIGGSLNVTSASTISGVTINSGVITGSLTGTATTATYANQSGYAITSGSSNTSGYATTSGLATTATYSHQSGYAITSGSANTALYSDQSGYGLTSGLASTATYAHQSGYAITSGTATTATNVNVVSASTSASHPVLFTPASGSASGAALSTESTFVYNPSTDILSVSGLAITSGTASTSSTTGALTVTGGVGISGRLHVGTSSTSIFDTPEYSVAGFAGSSDQAWVVIANTKTNFAENEDAFVRLILKSSDSNGAISVGNTSNGGNFSIEALYGLSFIAGADSSLTAPNMTFDVGTVFISNIYGDPTSSTGYSTGALVVTGGAGIALTSYFGQDVKILGSTASTNPTNGALVVAGGVGISGSLYVGSSSDFSPVPTENIVAGFNKSADNIYFVIKNSNTDPEFDTSAANIILAHSDNYAMIGIGKTVSDNGALLISSLYSGVSLYSGGQTLIQSEQNIYHSTGIGFDHRFSVDGIDAFSIASTGATFYNTTASTASTNGALQVSGGVGIGKTSYFGQDVKIQGTTGSASTTTGALVITGGVGIGGSIFTSSSNASSISGVILNNGAITNTGTITSTGVMTLSNSSTTAFQVRDGSNNPAFTIDTIGDIITLPVAIASTTTGTGSLVVAGGVGIGQSVSVGGRLQLFNSANYTAFVSSASGNTVYTLPATSPATGTSVLQSTSAGVMSWVPLAAGSGTVSTLTAGTGISFSTGATITTSGTIRARRPLVTSFCAGYTPAASGADSVVIRLPDSPSDGTTAITYEPQEFHIRVETASATTTTIQLEKYTGTGAFSGTAITSVSISGGSTYEAQTSVFAGAGIFLTSGDKLRINFTALSASHANFSVYLELEEV